MIKLSKIKLNPDNPRSITDEDFDRLVQNIEKYPKFLKLRPIIIESWEHPIIIAGNMRYKALKYLGIKELDDDCIKTADDFTPEEIAAFLVIDNASFGEWDMKALEQWGDKDTLMSWGVREDLFVTPQMNDSIETQYTKETEEKYKIVLEYTETDFEVIQEAFKKYSGSKESIVYNLLVKGKR